MRPATFWSDDEIDPDCCSALWRAWRCRVSPARRTRSPRRRTKRHPTVAPPNAPQSAAGADCPGRPDTGGDGRYQHERADCREVRDAAATGGRSGHQRSGAVADRRGPCRSFRRPARQAATRRSCPSDSFYRSRLSASHTCVTCASVSSGYIGRLSTCSAAISVARQPEGPSATRPRYAGCKCTGLG